MKKEVTKKRNKPINSGKNLEKKLKIDMKKCLINLSYLTKIEEDYKNNATSTSKTIEFNQTSNSSNKLNFDFNYVQENKRTRLPLEKSENSYKINSNYQFASESKNEKDKEINQNLQESNKTFYSLYVFEEKPEEEMIIKIQ